MNEHAPRLSLVTLSFNQAAFLPRCLASVAAQLCAEDEQWCVDPGSTDGSRDVLRAAAATDSRVRLCLEPDAGPADGLNKGFARAGGDVFAFLNADDELAPGALDFVRAHFMRRTAPPLLLGAVRFIDVASRARRRKRLSTAPSPAEIAPGAARFYQQGFFFQRAVWAEGVRFNVANRTCWDWEFFVDARLAGFSACAVTRELGRFREHAASITGRADNRLAYENDFRRIAEKAAAAVARGERVSTLRRWYVKLAPWRRVQEWLP
jgi:glycosyltransferase involved in cell wall biosynthesis